MSRRLGSYDRRSSNFLSVLTPGVHYETLPADLRGVILQSFFACASDADQAAQNSTIEFVNVSEVCEEAFTRLDPSHINMRIEHDRQFF